MRHAGKSLQSIMAAAFAVSMTLSGMPAGAQTTDPRRVYRPPVESTDAATGQATPNCPPGVYSRRCPDPEPPRRDDRDDDDGIDPVVAVAGAAVVGALIATWFSSGKKPHASDEPDAEALLENGPELPTTYPVGTFTVRGFAQNGWPVVLDFKPEPRTRTTLDIVYKKKTVSMVVDTNGMEGRHLTRFDLPKDGPAKKAKAATYVLRSVYLDGPDATDRMAPIEVYGIGGGPRAVGSVAIEKLSFQPGMVRAGAPARFDYSAKSPFNHTRAEVLKFVDAGDRIQLERVMTTSTDNVGIGEHSGMWDGRDQQNRASSLGKHRFQVRAWFTSDDKSWVGAIAPELVTVSQ